MSISGSRFDPRLGATPLAGSRPSLGADARCLLRRPALVGGDRTLVGGQSTRKKVGFAQQRQQPRPGDAALQLEGDPSFLPEIGRGIEALVGCNQRALLFGLRQEGKAPIAFVFLHHREALLLHLPRRVPERRGFACSCEGFTDAADLLQGFCRRLFDQHGCHRLYGNSLTQWKPRWTSTESCSRSLCRQSSACLPSSMV